MKKIIALAVLTLVASASLATAGGQEVTNLPSGSITGIKFSASANVKVFATSNDTQFAAESKHLNGTRTFGVTSVDTKVFYTDSSAGTALAAGPSTSDSTDFNSWSSL